MGKGGKAQQPRVDDHGGSAAEGVEQVDHHPDDQADGDEAGSSLN